MLLVSNIFLSRTFNFLESSLFSSSCCSKFFKMKDLRSVILVSPSSKISRVVLFFISWCRLKFIVPTLSSLSSNFWRAYSACSSKASIWSLICFLMVSSCLFIDLLISLSSTVLAMVLSIFSDNFASKDLIRLKIFPSVIFNLFSS